MMLGEQVDFDKVWTEEKQDERGEHILTNTLYHPEYHLDAEGYVLLVMGGLLTTGIWPVVDTFVHEINKEKRKHLEKLDSKRDIIAVSASEVLFFADKIKAKVSELVKKGHKVNVVVDGCAQKKELEENQRIEYNFDTQKLLKLWDLEYELKQLGMTEPLKFNEFFQTTTYSDLKSCWDLEQVIEANNEIDKVVRKIQNLKLSPYETMVYIHKYLTQNYGYGYNVSKKLDEQNARESEKNRSIVAAIKKKKTICAGYASLTKAIIDRLNMPELKCEYQIATCWAPKENTLVFNGGHALAHVTIEDPKYDIKGSYLNDATWDAKDKKHPYGRGYTYFMYPIMDAQKLSPMFLSDSYGSRTTIRTRDFTREIYPRSEDGSVPIPYDTFEKAVKQVYSLESDFCQGNEFNQTATQDIQLSLRRAWHSRTEDNYNPLVKQVDVVYKVSPKYNRKHEIKNVKFQLKNELINADKEISQ